MNAPFVQIRGDFEDNKAIVVSIPDIFSVPAYRLSTGFQWP
jgi:hypothetical protein